MTNSLTLRWVSRSVLCLAAVVLATALSRAAEPPKPPAGFQALFDGESLAGWKGDKKLWRAEDGMIVGQSPGIRRNEFLVTKKSYRDFELRLEFRLHKGAGNSGIQFRSELEPNSPQVIGYQADIGQSFWGCLYDEHRRRKTLVTAPKSLSKVLKPDGWNTYRIRAEGDHVQLFVNDLQTVDYRELDANIRRHGIIALQIHSGPPMQVDFRNLFIRELAKP